MQEVKAQSNSNVYNQATMRSQQIHEEHNTAENRQIIMDVIATGRGRDISDDPKVDKTPCFIIGSGPSLDDSIQHLKDWKGGIICTTSHARTLMRYGIEPTHIVCLDPFSLWSEIDGVDWSKTKTKLVTNPSVWPDLIKNWPNEMLFFLQNVGKKGAYHNTYQKRQFMRREYIDGSIRNANFHFLIRTEITSFACSPPCQMFIADILGYGNIFLAGVDFAFHSGKERFTSWSMIDGQWVASYSFVDKNKTYPITKNGLQTEDVHLYYKKNMISAWCLSTQQMYTTDHGAITECDYVDIKNVIKKKGVGFQPLPKDIIEQKAERYLASVGAFVVHSSGGKSFVEIDDETPLDTLEKFMYEINRKIVCKNCNCEMSVNNRDDGKLHEEDVSSALQMDCPQCKQKAIHRAAFVDIPYQLEKFDRLIKDSV